jgi:hypothetical protein
MIGSLPLAERLFMFYKRHERRMIPHIAAVAAYWAGEERTLEKVLKHKYKFNLEEEGLGQVPTILFRARLHAQCADMRADPFATSDLRACMYVYRPSSELMINMDVLQDEMKALHAQMSPDVVPESSWIPQHSNHLAPIALRDAVLLANAEVVHNPRALTHSRVHNGGHIVLVRC